MARQQLISIDFDGTIVEHAFPEIGALQPFVIETLKGLQDFGCKLVLNTCREDGNSRKYLTEAVEFMKLHGIEFRSVNENHIDDDFRAESLRRKVYANIYIDDRNLGGFPGWDAIAFYLLGMKLGRFEKAANDKENPIPPSA